MPTRPAEPGTQLEHSSISGVRTQPVLSPFGTCPAGHAVHDVDFGSEEYVPAGHALHDGDPASEYVPARQSTHNPFVPPSASSRGSEYCPALQSTHTVVGFFS